jgi:hypothetical protein
LEQLLLDGEGNPKAGPAPTDYPGCVYHASLLLAKVLQANAENSGRRFTWGEKALGGPPGQNCLQATEFAINAGEQSPSSGSPPSKKRKTNHEISEYNLLERNWDAAEDTIPCCCHQ